MKPRTILVPVFVVAAIVGMVLVATSVLKEQNRLSEQRTTYTGRVTAVQQGESLTTVYLNSDGQVISVHGYPLQLLVGREYEIILDGNGRLVNARIIGE